MLRKSVKPSALLTVKVTLACASSTPTGRKAICYSARCNGHSIKMRLGGASQSEPLARCLPTKATKRILRTGQPMSRSEEHTSQLQSLMRHTYAALYLSTQNNDAYLETDPKKGK